MLDSGLLVHRRRGRTDDQSEASWDRRVWVVSRVCCSTCVPRPEVRPDRPRLLLCLTKADDAAWWSAIRLALTSCDDGQVLKMYEQYDKNCIFGGILYVYLVDIRCVV